MSKDAQTYVMLLKTAAICMAIFGMLLPAIKAGLLDSQLCPTDQQDCVQKAIIIELMLNISQAVFALVLAFFVIGCIVELMANGMAGSAGSNLNVVNDKDC